MRLGWNSEPGDFTPWLAQEENLAVLAQTIGLQLELEAQEKAVGPFSAESCRLTVPVRAPSASREESHA